MLSHHQNAGKNHYIKVANRSFEIGQAQIFGDNSNTSNFDLWFITELRTDNSDNACYHSVQKLFSCLLSKNIFACGFVWKNTHWVYLRIGCWGEYSDHRGMN
jgi:hypothetical protein